jgi:hypothetical protein
MFIDYLLNGLTISFNGKYSGSHVSEFFNLPSSSPSRLRCVLAPTSPGRRAAELAALPAQSPSTHAKGRPPPRAGPASLHADLGGNTQSVAAAAMSCSAGHVAAMSCSVVTVRQQRQERDGGGGRRYSRRAAVDADVAEEPRLAGHLRPHQ